MIQDRELLCDILRASAKMMAQEALSLRVRYLGLPMGHSQHASEHDYMPMLNAAARCELLAQKYETKRQ
jgi:hypothetical protein